MADKIPLKAIYDGTDPVAIGEFSTEDTTPVSNGGTGSTTASGARSNLGLGDSATKNVGTSAGTVAAGDHAHSGVYQPLDADLTAVAGLTATGLIERTGNGTAGTITITAAGKDILDDSNAAAQRSTLGLGTAATMTGPSGTIVGTSDTQTLSGKTITGLKETKVALSAAAIDLATGNYFSKLITENTAFTVTNVPSAGTAVSFILDLTNGGAKTITWSTGFTSVKYTNGLAPTLTVSGRDILGFFTHDAGATWNCLVLGKDVK